MASQPLLFKEEQLHRPATAESMELMRREGIECKRCRLRSGCQRVVWGSGNSSRPDLALVGESPSEEEERLGLPFQGPSGELLTKMLASLGYRREDVYLANVVNCRPTRNRMPQQDEIRACSTWLSSQLRAIQPRVIISLGSIALGALLNDWDITLEKARGRWFEWEGIPMIPTFHPAYLLHKQDDKTKTWGDLKEVMKKLGKEIPISEIKKETNNEIIS